jgi:signal transduction histidine kinase
MRRLPLNRLSVKLSAILFAVVAVALGIVYVAVVPRLESRLVNAKIDELHKAAKVLPTQVNLSPLAIQQSVRLVAAQINARVVVFQRLGDDSLAVFADSSPVPGEIASDSVARAALADQDVRDGRSSRDDQEYAEVAFPARLSGGQVPGVVLLSTRLDDALTSVELVKRSLLIAGAVAFAISWFAGSMAALRVTSRIRRLEEAAERLADGNFDVPVRDDSVDEIGQLARAFDRTRIRLSQLDRARREFIANASHELRTPLFALGGFLELLADEELDETTRRDFLETARGQVGRLTRLATDLLDLSRMDAGQLELVTESVDLRAVAEALSEEFGPLAEGSGHRLGLVASGEAHALGDPERVQQIGRSLVENALRHTPGGTTVELRTGSRNGLAELEVHDDGPGIEADDREHVFERFYRGGSGAAFGSGIGLAIARELAQAMGGSIELESAPGGTGFRLMLPQAGSPAPFPRENALVKR